MAAWFLPDHRKTVKSKIKATFHWKCSRNFVQFYKKNIVHLEAEMHPKT